jgi:hypothetical protein
MLVNGTNPVLAQEAMNWQALSDGRDPAVALDSMKAPDESQDPKGAGFAGGAATNNTELEDLVGLCRSLYIGDPLATEAHNWTDIAPSIPALKRAEAAPRRGIYSVLRRFSSGSILGMSSFFGHPI